jgi:broad specificity phosphatase PhoE
METARAAFSETSMSDAHSDRTAGACRPLIASALVAERLDTACDIGTPKSELEQVYTDVDFSLLDEYWWYGGRENSLQDGLHHVREPWIACHRRIDQTLQWLTARPETCIAVVGHSSFFQAMTGSCMKLPNCGIMEICVGNHDADMQQHRWNCFAGCRRDPRIHFATDHRTQ